MTPGAWEGPGEELAGGENVWVNIVRVGERPARGERGSAENYFPSNKQELAVERRWRGDNRDNVIGVTGGDSAAIGRWLRCINSG